MKILCVAQYYVPHIGGLEIVAQTQARLLAEAGHSVTIVTTKIPESKTDEVDGVIRIVRAPALHFFERIFGIPFSLIGISMLRTLAREAKRADVIHLHDVFYMTSWAAYVFARWYGKRYVIVQHVGYVAHPSTFVRLIQKIVYGTIGSMLFAKSTRIIVFNPIVYEFLFARGIPEAKIASMQNGIDVTRFRPAIGDEKKKARLEFGLPIDRTIMLFVGRLVPKKGVTEVFEARDPAYEIVFAGSGAIPPAWRSRSNVHFLGPVPQDKLPDLYRAADVFVSPTRGELFTLSMQEACASGLPVVATDEPEYRFYTIDRSKISFIAPTTESIAREMQRLSAPTADRTAKGVYARTYARAWFDARRNGEALLALYARLEKRVVTVTTSWDDGHKLDLRLAVLLEKYGLRGTFYISPRDREIQKGDRLTSIQIKELSRSFEIGAHTMTHPHLTKIADADAHAEIAASKTMLETITGKVITSFCYPAGYFAKRHVAMLRQLGFTKARTVSRFETETGEDPLALPTTFHAYRHWSDAWSILRTAGLRRFVRAYLHWDETAIMLFDKTLQEGGVFHLWGHSWEIDRHRDWHKLERVFSHIGKRPGVAYVTNAELP